MNDVIKLSREEKYLLNALEKYPDRLKEFKTNDKLVLYLKKKLSHPGSNIDRSLKKTEVIELLKLINRADLIDALNNMILPSFPVTFTELLSHQVECKSTNEYKSVENYSAHRKINYNYLLKDLKLKWIESNFELTKADLLSQVDASCLEKYTPKRKKK